jgi:hypothetical protein
MIYWIASGQMATAKANGIAGPSCGLRERIVGAHDLGPRGHGLVSAAGAVGASLHCVRVGTGAHEVSL